MEYQEYKHMKNIYDYIDEFLQILKKQNELIFALEERIKKLEAENGKRTNYLN